MLYLYNFKKILDLGKYSLSNNADFKYILLKKQEIYAINDIINYAHHKPGGENHIEFLQEYKSLVEEHLSIINKIKGESDTLSNELTKFLNKEKYIKNDIVIINNHSFYNKIMLRTLHLI